MERHVDRNVVHRTGPDGFDVVDGCLLGAAVLVQFEAGDPGLQDRLGRVDDKLVANLDCLLGLGVDLRADRFAALRDDHALLDRGCRFDGRLVDVVAVVTADGRGAARLQHLVDGLVVWRTGGTGESHRVAGVDIAHWRSYRGCV